MFCCIVENTAPHFSGNDAGTSCETRPILVSEQSRCQTRFLLTRFEYVVVGSALKINALAALGGCRKPHAWFHKPFRRSNALPGSKCWLAGRGCGKPRSCLRKPACLRSTELPRSRLWLTQGGYGQPRDCLRKAVGAPPSCLDQGFG